MRITMVGYPLGGNVVGRLLARNGSLQNPLAREVVEQRRVTGGRCPAAADTDTNARTQSEAFQNLGNMAAILYLGSPEKQGLALISRLILSA